MRSAARRPTTCTTRRGRGQAVRRTRAPSSRALTSGASANRWRSPGPRGSSPTPTARPQFHHVIDIVPTIYEVTKITPPRVVNGFEQDSIDGVSMVYAFGDAKAPGTRNTQFFDIMASRGIYHDGWFASAPGPREPWVGGLPKGIKEWSPLTDKWELYHIDVDWSQANDLAATNPQKLEEMKSLFLLESTKNKNLPIGGGLWSTAMFHPEDAPASPLTEWTFDCAHHADARIRRAQARQGRQPGDDGGGRAGERQRRAVRAGRLLRRRHVLREGRLPELRVQPVRGAAHEDQVKGQAAAGQSEDRGRVEAGGHHRRADGRGAEGQRRRSSGRAGCRQRCRCTSRRTRPSTSAPIWIRPCRSTISTRRRSPSTAPSARRKSRT